MLGMVACSLVRPPVARAQDALWAPGIVPQRAEFRRSSLAIPPAAITRSAPKTSRERVGNALIGGTIGAFSGVIACTLISTLLVNSELDGITTCTTRGNLIFAGGGFVLGATIGALWND